MRNKFLFILLFLCAGLPVFPQFLDEKFYLLDSLIPKNINKNDRLVMDSLLKKYHSSQTDTARIAVLNAIAENTLDETVWKRYNELALAKTLQLLKTHPEGSMYKYLKRQEALALNNTGYYYFNYSDQLDVALEYYQKALNIQKELGNYPEMITCYSNMANVYQNKGDLIKAFELYNAALAMDSVVTEKKSFLAPLNNIAHMHLYVGDTAKALMTLKKCLSISMHNPDKNFLAHLLHNIGVLSTKQGDRTAQSSIYKALLMRQEIGDKKGIIQSLLSLAELQLKEGHRDICAEYLTKAKPLVDSLNNAPLKALYFSNLSHYYQESGKETEAVQNMEKAVNVYQQANHFSVEMLTTVKTLLQLYGSNPAYAGKKLKLYELRYFLEARLQKNEAQRLTMKQSYEQSLKLQETEFKARQAVKEEKNRSEKRRQQFVIYVVLLVLLIVIVFSFFLFKAFTRIKKSNTIISLQKTEVERQKQIIEEKHKDITDSITYAHRIQSALIPTPEQLTKRTPNISVLFLPRDIVSGDFYWHTQLNNDQVFALADCTGHGVPGAFMSIIGLNQLDTLINEKNIESPASVLNALRKGIIASLNSNSNEPDKRDGMDIALIYFNGRQLRFSGANLSVYIARHETLSELKGNKQPIGISERNEDFTEQTYDLLPGDRIFLLSDGLPDQFGGADGKKLKIRKVKEWFIETLHLSLHEQKKSLTDKLLTFKAHYEQTDDITLAIIEI